VPCPIRGLDRSDPAPERNGRQGPTRAITKAGDRNLRRLLVLGATSLVNYARRKPEQAPWIVGLLARRPVRVVTVAIANKMARTAWALLSRGGEYRRPSVAAA
jgi:transposase